MYVCVVFFGQQAYSSHSCIISWAVERLRTLTQRMMRRFL